MQNYAIISYGATDIFYNHIGLIYGNVLFCTLHALMQGNLQM